MQKLEKINKFMIKYLGLNIKGALLIITLLIISLICLILIFTKLNIHY